MKKILIIGLFVLMILSVSAILPASQDVVCCYDAQDEEGNINETHLSTEKCSEFELDKETCLSLMGTQSKKDYLEVTYGENPCSTETECQEFCDSNEIDEAMCFGIMQKWVKEEPVEENNLTEILLYLGAAIVIIWAIYKFKGTHKKKKR